MTQLLPPPNLNKALFIILAGIALTQGTFAREYHVSPFGNDTADGSSAHPLKSIGAAARLAMPGDTVTVHAGTYRERVAPPRGGTDDQHRITYQAAPGEKAVITGSEPVKGWKKLSGDAWELTLPNSYFGAVNPFDELLYGSWYQAHGTPHHTGNVYLDDVALKETFSGADLLKPAGSPLLWHATADGNGGPILMNIDWIKPAGQNPVGTEWGSAEGGDAAIYLGAGHAAFGYLKDNSRLHYDHVDFGKGASSLEVLASSLGQGGLIDIHLNGPDGPIIGSGRVTNTGDWDQYKTFAIPLSQQLAGKQNLCLILKAPPVKPGGTTVIQAQFPAGVDPNMSDVEISVRSTVFYPDKTGVNYVTVRGFTLCNAATNWAPPSAEQVGLIGPHWAKGWIIENNTILNSRCSGISLGRPTYGHAHHYQKLRTAVYPEPGSGQTAAQLADYFENGSWDKNAAGHHIVRDNIIAHCGQAGIVGCSGGAFSLIEGNDIHDIDCGESYTGQEMGCIKLHFPIDTIIRNNHLYECGGCFGLWLDWGTQGTRVEGNLFHDNWSDMLAEVTHGPLVIANNLFLSRSGMGFSAQGLAFVHNLVAESINVNADDRQTFLYRPHDTVSLGKHNNPAGDIRWLNNIFAGAAPSAVGHDPAMPVVTAGNVYIAGADPDGGVQKWLMNVEWFKPLGGAVVRAAALSAKNGTQLDTCSEGGQNVGFIRAGNWVRYQSVDFGQGATSVDVRAAADNGYGGVIELHAGDASGELLGSCEVPSTGGWQSWRTFTVPIKRSAGAREISLVFVSKTTGQAQETAQASNQPIVAPEVPSPKLEHKADGWYLTFSSDASWRDTRKRDLVTTSLLGRAVVPNCAFENPDGSPLVIDTDYFGLKRDAGNPFPGPFESPKEGLQTAKVWPKR